MTTEINYKMKNMFIKVLICFWIKYPESEPFFS